MVSFSFLSGLVLGAGASLAVLTLWRSSRAPRVRTGYLLAGAGLAAFAAAAGIIYVAIGAQHSLTQRPAGAAGAAFSTPAKSMQAEVAALEARLSREGGSPADWTLLAQAYDLLGEAEDAQRARARIARPPSAAASPMSAGALAAAAAATEAVPAVPPSAAAPVVHPAPASAADLEQHLKAKPGDAREWLALADLRRARRDYPGARDAYARVVDLKAMSAQSWADYADVLGSLAHGSLGGAGAAQAIDSALARDASNAKALWLKASQAHEQHRYTEALAWWKRLRAVLPPGAPDVQMVEGNIAEDSALAGVSASATVSGTPAAVLSGTVSLDTRFASRVPPHCTLFIYAKAADSPGPPLAVLRTTAAAWPVSFRLDDSMAMIPSRRLSQFDKVVVEARISQSGQATPGAGDLYVTSPVVRPVGGVKLALVINREIG
jgi:cytochrome c-type biogenesis protein CcmH